MTLMTLMRRCESQPETVPSLPIRAAVRETRAVARTHLLGSLPLRSAQYFHCRCWKSCSSARPRPLKQLLQWARRASLGT